MTNKTKIDIENAAGKVVRAVIQSQRETLIWFADDTFAVLGPYSWGYESGDLGIENVSFSIDGFGDHHLTEAGFATQAEIDEVRAERYRKWEVDRIEMERRQFEALKAKFEGDQMNTDEINARVAVVFNCTDRNFLDRGSRISAVYVDEGRPCVDVDARHLTAADLRALADALEPQAESIVSVGGATFTLKGGPQHSVTVGVPPARMPNKIVRPNGTTSEITSDGQQRITDSEGIVRALFTPLPAVPASDESDGSVTMGCPAP